MMVPGVPENEWQRDYAAVASYTPRAFSIQLLHGVFAAASMGDTFSVPQYLFPTVLHEIAHLVQDRATLRGVIDFVDYWDQVEAIAAYVETSGADVQIPVVEPNGTRCRLPARVMYARELELLRRCREPRSRWTRNVDWTFVVHEVEIRTLMLNGNPIETPLVWVNFEDASTGTEYRHLVGAWEIKEAYSVAVGNLHGARPKSRRVGYEYHAVSTIAAAYLGSLSPRQLIAICHWALHDLSPAVKLFSILDELRRAGPVPSAHNLYDRLRHDFLHAELEANWNEMLEIVAAHERAHRDQGNESVAALFHWFHEHAERLFQVQIRAGRRFPLDTFLCRDSRRKSACTRNRALREFFSEVEVPLVFLPNGEAHTIGTSDDGNTAAFLNHCTFDLVQSVWRGKQHNWRCPIYGACNLALKDAACLTQPWLKSRVHPTCAYGAAGKLIGLNVSNALHFAPFPPLPIVP